MSLLILKMLAEDHINVNQAQSFKKYDRFTNELKISILFSFQPSKKDVCNEDSTYTSKDLYEM